MAGKYKAISAEKVHKGNYKVFVSDSQAEKQSKKKVVYQLPNGAYAIRK